MSGTTKLNQSLFEIAKGSPSAPTYDGLLRLARDFKILVEDDRGRYAIPTSSIPVLRRFWQLTRRLRPINCKSLAEMQAMMETAEAAE